MSNRRVLVVGTTPDYIAHIHGRYPGRALFLTDKRDRPSNSEGGHDKASEVVAQLADTEGVLELLNIHLDLNDQCLSGVTCFDCKWLVLAAELADRFELTYPSMKSVLLSMNKALTKRRWAEAGVRCPRIELVYTGWQALRLAERVGSDVVLKPCIGTGSELTFLCCDEYDVTVAFYAIRSGLAKRIDPSPVGGSSEYTGVHGLQSPILAEEYVSGREYSADFIVDEDDVHIVRLAKKVRSLDHPFGTTMAYVVPAKLPTGLDEKHLEVTFGHAARALGLRHAICMVDFIIKKDEVVLLELSPRIGGDCLPPLIATSCGLDTIELAMDFAENREYHIPPIHQWNDRVGLRLLSTMKGILRELSCGGLQHDSRVRKIELRGAPGQEIVLPPEDYDSWVLGYVIFEPDSHSSIRQQCNDLFGMLTLIVEPSHENELTAISDEEC